MSINLKPCPFCGSAATLEDERLLWVARCTACGACVLGDRAPEPEQEMPATYWEPFRRSAVDLWNRRAAHAIPLPPAAQPAPVAAPAGGLVERVANAIGDGSFGNWLPEARAAIREVAAWLDQQGQHGCSLLLREEADR